MKKAFDTVHATGLELIGQVSKGCGYMTESGQGGFVLTSDVIQRLATFPINVLVDLYLSPV